MKGISRRSFVRSTGAIAAVPALGTVAASLAEAQGAAAIEVEKDIRFGTGGGLDLHLDVYHPVRANAKRMAIIHLHGGGFSRGNKEGVEIPARAFTAQGYVSVASAYRLTGQARWPAPIEDTKAAIRWTRANAERLNIDADKIAIAGYSAGGLLALFAAGTGDRREFEGNGGNAGISSKVAACIAVYPAVTATRGLMPEGHDGEAARAAASPGAYISAGFAPSLFVHGVADEVIPYTSSVDFFDQLHTVGVKADLHLFQGATHAFVTRNEDAALAAAQVANLFLDRVVINPKAYPPFAAA
jgi:acetyl esterase/lipase